MQAPTMPHRLLIISQVYPPDPAAVGQHIGDVAEEMTRRGATVRVYTAGRGYDDPSVRYPARESRGGVDVRRLPLSSFGKGGIAIRLVAQSLFVGQALLRGLLDPRPDVILVTTSPPFGGFAGSLLAWLRRVPVVWWVMDINPDQMVRSGRLRSSSTAARLFDWMNRFTLRQARDVIVLDRFMRDTILAKADVPHKLHVVPPWAHDNVLEPVAHANNPFRATHGFGDRFVVMYSGNAGYSTPLDTLLEAAKRLAHDDRVLFVFIGGGVVKKQIDDMVARDKPRNIRTFPYQPFDQLRYSLSAADVHVVSVADEAVGVVHPCKIYGALAVGRPVIALASKESHAADIVAVSGGGWVVQHGDVDPLVDLLKRLTEEPKAELDTLGERASMAAKGPYARTQSLNRVCAIIESSARATDRR